MIPNGSKYPIEIDTDDNLFLVHDSLRVRLLYDYIPGDDFITIEDTNNLMQYFPDTGIITLTEQCSDIDTRAISFYYGSRTSTTFEKLELLPNFEDVAKFKKITNVTMNVLDKHHNHLKDALITWSGASNPKPIGGIQYFAGISDTYAVDYDPTKNYTLTERINFLKKIIYRPKAWFTCDKEYGIIEDGVLSVKFTSESLKTQNIGNIKYDWDFGDGFSESVENQNTIIHNYARIGSFDVTLTVSNDYGSDSVTFEELINIKSSAPESAIINIIPKYNQILTPGQPVGGPYYEETPPKIRSPINVLIELEIPQGVGPIRNPQNPNIRHSYKGEVLDNDNKPIDEVVEYNWDLGDELIHDNTYFTKASYGIGGYYDISLRVDTKYGVYRITKYQNSIDIVEMKNLWLFNYVEKDQYDGGEIKSYEFGTISETFKLQGSGVTRTIDRSNSFLSVYNSTNYNPKTFENAKKEFKKNVLFTSKGVDSGRSGECLLFYARGGSSNDNNQINIENYNAFSDVYSSLTSLDSRPWNWVGLPNGNNVDFILGSTIQGDKNFALNKRSTYNISNSTNISRNLISSDFENGAQEILENISNYTNGIATNGYFSTYRSTWNGQNGYILRNSAVNEFFRISNFYRTNGTSSDLYSTLTKMPDMTGLVKTEGELVSLSSGVFFFDNSGEVMAWNTSSGTWEVGRLNSSTLSFRSLQDTSIQGYDDKSNTLLAVSNNDKLVYLSFDYSNNIFIKFNATDLTFTSLGSKPNSSGNYGQFKIGLY